MAAEKFDIAQIIDSSSYLVFNAQRKATFNNGKWVYDKEEGAACTGVKLADAGFCNTSTRSDPSAATWVFCLKEMIFDSTDDPWNTSIIALTLFVRFNQQEDNRLTIERFINLIAFRETKTMLADAGFCNTSTRSDPSAATCVFCLKEMIFDSTDDPWNTSIIALTLFVRFNQQEDNRLTIEQFINLIAFRKTKTMSAWLETQMKQVSSAVEYVQKMKPK